MGNESILDLSVVVIGDVGGFGVFSDCFVSSECLLYGMVSLCGWRWEMEDVVVLKDFFVKLFCNEVGGCDVVGLEVIFLYYFGVYDGYGGL